MAVDKDTSPDWAVEILRYHKDRNLPEEDKLADRIVR
jgi:hypothetical protein